MAQSRLHNVATIFSRIDGMIKAGTVAKNDIPTWYFVYKKFPPQRPPDSERPLVKKPLKPILYPEDSLRAQFYKTYHSSIMTGELGLKTVEDMTGGVGELFLKSFELVRNMRPHYHEDDIWYLCQRWIQDGVGIPLTHRGEATRVKDGKSADRRMATIKALDVEELKKFVEQIEKDELVDDGEEEEQAS